VTATSPITVRMFNKTESQVTLASREGEGVNGDTGRREQVPWWNDRTRMEKMCSVLAVFLVFLSVALCVSLVLVARGQILRVSYKQGVKA
jgi:hypothetical protein